MGGHGQSIHNVCERNTDVYGHLFVQLKDEKTEKLHGVDVLPTHETEFWWQIKWKYVFKLLNIRFRTWKNRKYNFSAILHKLDYVKQQTIPKYSWLIISYFLLCGLPIWRLSVLSVSLRDPGWRNFLSIFSFHDCEIHKKEHGKLNTESKDSTPKGLALLLFTLHSVMHHRVRPTGRRKILNWGPKLRERTIISENFPQ